MSAIVVSPDGWLVASGSNDKESWSASSRPAARSRVWSHTGRIYAVAFSPDATRIATGDGAGRVWIWSTDGTRLASLVGHTEWVTALAVAQPW